MLNYREEVSHEHHRLTQNEFTEKYQCSEKSEAFKKFTRACTSNGWTPERVLTEAVQRNQTWIDAGFIPDVFFQQILEGTQYRQISRQFANVYNAPEGQPMLHYREFDRFIDAQIVGEDDEFKARSGETKVQSMPFYTIGDRVAYTWQTLKDLPIDQTGQDLRAIGAMISLMEDRFVLHALWEATTGQNATDFINQAIYEAVSAYLPFAELMRWKARMGAPTEISHPDMPETVRHALLNLYNANVLLVPPRVYEDIVTNYLTMDQTFWRNSKILDDGSIDTAFGMKIYRVNTGYFGDTFDWHETNSIYFIDSTLGGVDLVFKEPLQLVDWPTNENRRTNMMVYERLNAIVRNRRSIFRLEVMEPTGSAMGS